MITVFLPCRSGSERVKEKNTKPFCGIKGGLLAIKMQQLLGIKSVDKILVSTNDDIVKEIVSKYRDDRILIDERCDSLSSSQTRTDDLIKYVPSIIAEGDILWTHVTSPFVDSKIYENSISKYNNAKKEGYDSLMSVHEIRGFIWNKSGPVNYDVTKEKWPRTQTLKPIYEVNSAIFIANICTYKEFDNRIGNNPYLYNLTSLQSLDIDWEEDFEFSEKLWRINQ